MSVKRRPDRWPAYWMPRPCRSARQFAGECWRTAGRRWQWTSVRFLNRRTLATTIEIVDAVRADQLDLPTPCAEWTLRQLLGHMIGQHYGFAAAARGKTSDLSVWADRP